MKLRVIPTSEGYFDALSNQYVYNYTDHLGNVRLSYSDTNKDGIVQARQYRVSECDGPWDPFNPPNCIDYWKPGEIVEVNNFYPFGLLHNYTATTQNAYQYKYNGKELQETGMYDYGARFYMPDIGRWGVMDPLSELYRRYSPYNYTVNNPINFTDPDGRWVKGAGFWNNMFKSDARIHAEKWADQLGSGNYNVTVNKGQHGWQVDSHTTKASYTDYFNSEGRTNTLIIPYSEGGGLGTPPAPGDPWGAKISSIPESRGKTDIQMHVSEHPLVQGAAIDLLTAGTGRFLRNLSQVNTVVEKVGHTVPWAEMTKAERRAFQHSYSRHAKEFDLPNWSQSQADINQELFNNAVTNVRAAGAEGFFNSRELINGVKTTVNRTEPIINGQKYYYYETLQGKFISSGKMP